MRSMRIKVTKNNNGFTLIELIVVIVLLGVIGTFTFSYIGLGTQIFVDASAREQLVTQSRFAVQRFQREIRNAVPRSVRTNSSDSNQCIEFMPITTSGRYLEIPTDERGSNTEFVSVTPLVTESLDDSYVFVYAISPAYIYAEDDSRRKRLESITLDMPTNGLSTFTFSNASSAFGTESPTQRFYISSGPISWCVNTATGELLRFNNYSLSVGQPSSEDLRTRGTFEVMATALSNTSENELQWPFRVFEPSLVRNGLVQINWYFQTERTGEPLVIIHEVHIPNAP